MRRRRHRSRFGGACTGEYVCRCFFWCHPTRNHAVVGELEFLIDSGMSHGIEGSDSTGGALRIRNGSEATVICANGSQKVLWDKEMNSDRGAKHCTKEP